MIRSACGPLAVTLAAVLLAICVHGEASGTFEFESKKEIETATKGMQLTGGFPGWGSEEINEIKNHKISTIMFQSELKGWIDMLAVQHKLYMSEDGYGSRNYADLITKFGDPEKKLIEKLATEWLHANWNSKESDEDRLIGRICKNSNNENIHTSTDNTPRFSLPTTNMPPHSTGWQKEPAKVTTDSANPNGLTYKPDVQPPDSKREQCLDQCQPLSGEYFHCRQKCLEPLLDEIFNGPLQPTSSDQELPLKNILKSPNSTVSTQYIAEARNCTHICEEQNNIKTIEECKHLCEKQYLEKLFLHHGQQTTINEPFQHDVFRPREYTIEYQYCLHLCEANRDDLIRRLKCTRQCYTQLIDKMMSKTEVRSTVKPLHQSPSTTIEPTQQTTRGPMQVLKEGFDSIASERFACERLCEKKDETDTPNFKSCSSQCALQYVEQLWQLEHQLYFHYTAEKNHPMHITGTSLQLNAH